MSRRSPTSRLLFSQKAVQKLRAPRAGRVHVYDEREEGLGIRLEAGGRKSFFWFRKVRGVPTFRSIGTFPATSVDQARSTAQEWNGDLEEYKRHGYEGENPFARASGEPTLGELRDRYIEQRLKKRAAHPDKAEEDVRWMFKKYLAAFESRKLSQIDRKELRELHEKLTKDNGPITADRVIELARRLYYWAGGDKVELWKGENPAVRIELNGDVKRDRFLQPDELVRLDKALKTEKSGDLRDFVTLALATGARRSNVLGMEWSQIDQQHWIWNIPRTSAKNKLPQVVALTPRAVDVLKHRWELRTSSPFVFPSHSACGHLVELKRPWGELLKRAQINDCTIHDLRRTNASYQAISGQSLQAIAATLGHASVQSTQIYARLNSDAARLSLLAGADAMQQAMVKARRQKKQRTA